MNADCAKEWLKDNRHLPSTCACLEQEIHQDRQRAEEWAKYLANSLQEKQELLKKCSCQKSEKTRTPFYDWANYDYTYCEKCEKEVKGAGKMGIIKNRNNPNFWGLEIKEKVLCGSCLEERKEKMPPLRKAEFNRYRKTGRL